MSRRPLSRRKVADLKDFLLNAPETDRPPLLPLVDRIILSKDYEGIRDQDGWETLELTVRSAHGGELSDDILTRLQQLQAQSRSL